MMHSTRAFITRAAWRANLYGFHCAKRGIDIAGAAVILLLLLPLFAVVALAVRLESKGSIFFRQVRVGQFGRTFAMWKFRSMYVDAEARRATLENAGHLSGGIRFKMKGDPRITRIGRLIRRASIDELPQLWNVLRGDMSLVGPRPPLPLEVAAYTLTERTRLDVPPGITCTWQVSGRSEIPFDRQVEMDIDYIHAQSIRFDLRLLLQTVPAVVFGRGAC